MSATMPSCDSVKGECQWGVKSSCCLSDKHGGVQLYGLTLATLFLGSSSTMFTKVSVASLIRVLAYSSLMSKGQLHV